jgi:hypothetical protein
MPHGKSLAAMLIVAGGLAVVASAPARAASCCGFTPQPSYNSGLHSTPETDAEREARLAKAKAQREARKAARAAKKAEEAKKAAAAAAPAEAAATQVASNN